VLLAIRALSRTCIDMCQGQALEAVLAGRLDATEEAYLEVIRLKTATFCATAAQIGAQLGGADEEAIMALTNFGHHLGMAFQVVDDLLPYVGECGVLGKPSASDLRNRRVTLPVIYAMQSRERAVTSRIREIFALGNTTHADAYCELVHLLNVTRALDHTRNLAYRHTMQAKRELDRLPFTEARERLRALAEIFMSRDH
jgi:geranylgeranyl pyrophosphate synthase